MFDLMEMARGARRAAIELGGVDRARKDAWLRRAAELLEAQGEDILAANRQDLENARQKGMSAAFIERLTLTPQRIAQMAAGLEAVAELEDPSGQVLEDFTRPNGLRIRKVRVPLGVVAIIYESRPNVTVDAAALCVKAGNAAVLRGRLRRHSLQPGADGGASSRPSRKRGCPGAACSWWRTPPGRRRPG